MARALDKVVAGAFAAAAWIILLALCLGLASCATNPGRIAPAPKVVTETVKVQVPVACVPKDFPPPPKYPATPKDIANAPSPDVMLKLLYADFKLMWARLGEDEPALQTCQQR